jgi:mono/diheme cytochrome c family protein
VKAALVAILVVAAGCHADATGGSVDGKQIFATTCTSCHGPTGKPDAAMVARLNVRDLTSAELRARVTPALVENQVRHGSQNKLMPGFEGALTDEQIKAVAAWVASPEFLAR